MILGPALENRLTSRFSDATNRPVGLRSNGEMRIFQGVIPQKGWDRPYSISQFAFVDGRYMLNDTREVVGIRSPSLGV